MENETFLKAAGVVMASQGGQAEVAAPTPETPETQVSAEMAVDQPADVTAPITPVAESVTEVIPPSTSEPYNYWPDLEQRTEGLVKDEETLAQALERVKGYDIIVQEKEELQKTLFKPANEYISKLNEMTLAGENPDKINAFVKLNGYGDLATLSPTELRTIKMVLEDGFSEDIARKIVTREYDLSQFDEENQFQKEEADIMRDKMRVNAEKDLKFLNEYKKELSVVNNPEKENAEKARLQQIANATTYNRNVERDAPVIAKHFPEKLNYEFKVGDETVPYEDNFDKQFLEKDLAVHVQEYFKDSMDPVTPENIGQAYSFALGEYLKENDSKRLEKAFQKGHTTGWEKAVNKYENRSGLPKAPENQVIATNEAGLTEFTKKMVGRT